MAAFTSEGNKKNPNIHKNSQEFRLCSLFLKEFKIGLLPYLNQLKGESVHHSLMKLFMEIKGLDRSSKFGEAEVYKGLQTEKGATLLRQFVFNRYARICTQIGNPQIDREQLSVEWSSFAPQRLSFPKLATHGELSVLLLVYHPNQALFRTYQSKVYRFSKEDTAEAVRLTVDGPTAPEDDALFIFVGGLKFIEVWNDAEYDILGRTGFGMEVLGVVERC